jgi:hypothetical protein
MQQGTGAPTPEEDALPVFTLGIYALSCHCTVAQHIHLQPSSSHTAAVTHSLQSLLTAVLP